MRLFRDYETFSHLKLGQGGHGLGRYSRDPSTEPLMLAWAFDKKPVQQTVFESAPEGYSRHRQQRWYRDQLDREYAAALDDPAVVKSAWNAQFEIQIDKHVLGLDVDLDQHQCSMALAMTLSFPGALDRVGKIIGLPEDKKKLSRGKALIRRFCGLRKPTKGKPHTRETAETAPVEWEEFLEYNRQDIVTERAIWRRLRRWDMPDHEWEAWRLDQEINEAGLPINRAMVENAVRLSDAFVSDTLDEMREVTGLRNPNSTAQLLPWLKARGYQFDDLKKGHVVRALEDAEKPKRHFLLPDVDVPPDEDYAFVLEARRETAKTSTKKFGAILHALNDDDLLRFCFQFAGAQRTWRWAGRILQPQNLPRPPKALEKLQEALARAIEDAGSVEALVAEFGALVAKEWRVAPLMQLLAAAIRPAIQAPEGYVFADLDFNAIENRVLGWLSDDWEILKVFIEGLDPYVQFATKMFARDYDTLWHEYKVLGDSTKRTTSKPAVLGCGYQLSGGFTYENESTGEIEATGLLGYAWNMGVRLDEETAQRSVAVWRETHKKTVEYWYEIERAMRRCIATGQSTAARRVSFAMDGPFCKMRLPSGRHLHYCRPALEDRMMPWGKVKKAITYEGLNDKGQWTRVHTGPGKIVENADQAISRDLLSDSMLRARREGFDIRLHVHDQIVPLVPEDRAQESVDLLNQIMTTRPSWAQDLPLGVGGGFSKVFLKD